MCISGGKSLIHWLHEQQDYMKEYYDILPMIKDEILTLPKDKKLFKYLFPFLKEKGLNGDGHLVQIIIQMYKNDNDLDDYYIPILTEEQEHKLMQALNEMLSKTTRNLCVHYMFILVKFLEIIGEDEIAQKCRKVHYKDKWERYENTWKIFTSSLNNG